MLMAALALPRINELNRWTNHILWVIAVTGMRIFEAMSLELDDVDLGAGVLNVRPTKLGKSLLVLLHATTWGALRSYADLWRVHLGLRCGSTCLSLGKVAGCCTLTSIVSSGGYTGWLVCAVPAIEPGRVCTISGLASRSERCSAGIAQLRTWSSSVRRSPPASAIPTCAVPIGVSRAAPSWWRKRRLDQRWEAATRSRIGRPATSPP